jgi:hypothetical protein
MGTEAKPYDRVHFVLFIFKSPRSGTANLFANGCNSNIFILLPIHAFTGVVRPGTGHRGRGVCSGRRDHRASPKYREWGNPPKR